MRAIFLLAITAINFMLFVPRVFAVEVNILAVPESVCREEELEVGFNIFDDLHPLSNYSYKIRVGSASANLNQVETLNPSQATWFDDTSSWVNLPTIVLDENGIATLSATAKTKKSAFIGNNLLIVRVNKDGKNYDSQAKNILIIEASPSPTLIPTEEPIVTPIPPTSSPTQTPLSYNNIFISEVMVNPQTGEKEWVEIFNKNESAVLLDGWFIDDLENQGSTPKIFNLEIQAKNYAVLDLSSAVFNNGGDSVRLLDFDKKEKDGFEYSLSVQGKTWGRSSFDGDIFCIQEPSRGKENHECRGIDPTQGMPPEQSPTPTTTVVVRTPTTKIIAKNKTTAMFKTQTEYNIPEGEVLGIVSDEGLGPEPEKFLRFFALNSVAYSLLTIFLLSFKIKFRS